MYLISPVHKICRCLIVGAAAFILLSLLTYSVGITPAKAECIEIPSDAKDLTTDTYDGHKLFKFEVKDGDTLKAFVPKDADNFSMILYSPDGCEIRRGNNREGPGTSTLEYTFTWDDTWYLEVFGPEQYNLQITWSQDGKTNHPPKVTLEYVGDPDNPWNKIVFVAKATDEDGDELKFDWTINGTKASHLSNEGTKQGNVTTASKVMAYPFGMAAVEVRVSDERGGIAKASTSFIGAGPPTEPYIEVVSGKVKVNGTELTADDRLRLSIGDTIESDPASSHDLGGYAIIRYPLKTSLLDIKKRVVGKIGPNTYLRFYDKQLQLLRGKLHIEGTPAHDIKVDGPYTLEQQIESIDDRQEREKARERINQIGTSTSIGKWAGTEFEVITEEDGTTSYYVFEDVVDVSDIDINKTVMVRSGETTTVKPNGVPSYPTPFDTNSVDKWWATPDDTFEEVFADTTADTTALTGLTFESRSKTRWSTVQIPLTLNGIQEAVGNMDLVLFYDPTILEATEIIKGSLTSNCLFDYNIEAGTARISLADNEGFHGDGSVGYVRFNVIGIEGSTSPLDISAISSNRAADYASMNISSNNGIFHVAEFDESIADCNGDGKVSAVDALCALQMAVDKIPEDMVMDVTGDERVSSLDARQILQMAVGKEGSADMGALPTDIEQFETLARNCESAEMTLSVGQNNEMEILYRVEGETDGNCVLYEKVVKDDTELGLEGKDMTCDVPVNIMTEGGALGADFNIKDYCSGPLADAIEEIGKVVTGEE